MSAWHSTVLTLLDANVDRREDVTLPIMSQTEMKRFAKLAIQYMPGAKKQFNEVFGGSRPASDFPMKRLIDAGVPAFLWEGK
jgi:hypothetical protein